MSGIEFKSQRLDFFDIARFFAIFGVIVVHVGQNSLPSLFFGDLYNFGRFGVQLFFIISGATVYLTYNKAEQIWSSIGYKIIVKYKLKSKT